jgi:hypothetical protein
MPPGRGGRVDIGGGDIYSEARAPKTPSRSYHYSGFTLAQAHLSVARNRAGGPSRMPSARDRIQGAPARPRKHGVSLRRCILLLVGQFNPKGADRARKQIPAGPKSIRPAAEFLASLVSIRKTNSRDDAAARGDVVAEWLGMSPGAPRPNSSCELSPSSPPLRRRRRTGCRSAETLTPYRRAQCVMVQKQTSQQASRI